MEWRLQQFRQLRPHDFAELVARNALDEADATAQLLLVDHQR